MGRHGHVIRLSQYFFLISFTLWVCFLQTSLKGIELEAAATSALNFRPTLLLFRASIIVIVVLLYSVFFRNFLTQHLVVNVSPGEEVVYKALYYVALAALLALFFLLFVTVPRELASRLPRVDKPPHLC